LFVKKHFRFRKPHKTHRIVSDVNIAPSQVVFVADGDLASASNVDDLPLTDVIPPPRHHATTSKLSSEQFGLPEGV